MKTRRLVQSASAEWRDPLAFCLNFVSEIPTGQPSRPRAYGHWGVALQYEASSVYFIFAEGLHGGFEAIGKPPLVTRKDRCK
eukprot:6171387-Pyramimonas_sp.AAC.2